MRTQRFILTAFVTCGLFLTSFGWAQEKMSVEDFMSEWGDRVSLPNGVGLGEDSGIMCLVDMHSSAGMRLSGLGTKMFTQVTYGGEVLPDTFGVLQAGPIYQILLNGNHLIIQVRDEFTGKILCSFDGDKNSLKITGFYHLTKNPTYNDVYFCPNSLPKTARPEYIFPAELSFTCK